VQTVLSCFAPSIFSYLINSLEKLLLLNEATEESEEEELYNKFKDHCLMQNTLIIRELTLTFDKARIRGEFLVLALF